MKNKKISLFFTLVILSCTAITINLNSMKKQIKKFKTVKTEEKYNKGIKDSGPHIHTGRARYAIKKGLFHHQIMAINLATWEPKVLIGHKNNISQRLAIRDRRYMVAISDDNIITMWNLENEEEAKESFFSFMKALFCIVEPIYQTRCNFNLQRLTISQDCNNLIGIETETNTPKAICHVSHEMFYHIRPQYDDEERTRKIQKWLQRFQQKKKYADIIIQCEQWENNTKKEEATIAVNTDETFTCLSFTKPLLLVFFKSILRKLKID